jgi:hypothetical protein
MRARTILLPVAVLFLVVLGGVLCAHTSGIVVPPSHAGETRIALSTYKAVQPVITYPVNDATYGSDWTGTITGTASSNSGASTTIASTEVAIEDTSANMWWNGSSFVATSQIFVPASGTASWSLALGADNLTSGDSYSVVAEATDSAGNLGTSPTVTFTAS